MAVLTRSLFAAVLAALSVAVIMPAAPALAQDISVDAILNDPQAPVGGNLKGDVTIVAFLDYNCPFCKKSAPDLEKLVKADGRIRLVYKDWPILTPASIHGAQLALAAKRQGKYEQVHHALMAIPGMRISKEKMTEAVQRSGVDMERLNADLKQHGAEIQELIQRNLDQADALGLTGTPVYLIGPFKASGALTYEQFRKAVADARAQGKQ
ncbi:DsbA family protein [Microvirga arsenatis]|uniref:Thioredoxin domain-containing protein n=1 Tax=Microvirga arsenatis TaxID=2692265 RepID=A0ABW9YVK7_9HYPH|nr:thioredoxin domain-containing protein [Microvirga arsenatis]NBJ24397.1 thioredoxin domain-containing protein [Microvirga arsenatis]